MKIRVEDQRQLADAVTWVAKSLPSRPSVPVLAGVKLETVGGDLKVSGFDYEKSTQAELPATVDSDGAVLVSGRLLAEIMKALPAKPVELAAVGTHLELVCGSARFTLPTMPVEDYPSLPDMPSAAGTVDASAFASAVGQVAVAAGRDETLPMMTGVRIEAAGNTLALLATDRYRLAVREIEWTPEQDVEWNALVPAATLSDTAKAMGSARTITIARDVAALGEGSIGFAAGSRRTTSRLLDGANYPPVRSLFPKPEQVQANAVVSAAGLTEVVKRVALVADRTTPVLLTFSPDGLVVEAGGTEEARASEAMEARYTGTPLTVGFNPQYLLDGLTAIGSQRARLDFVDAFKPAVITPAGGDGETVPGYRYLIMPIRVTR